MCNAVAAAATKPQDIEEQVKDQSLRYGMDAWFVPCGESHFIIIRVMLARPRLAAGTYCAVSAPACVRWHSVRQDVLRSDQGPERMTSIL